MRIKRWLGNILHNSIAHPLMPFLPQKWGDAFHDWTIKFWYLDIEVMDIDDIDTDTMDEVDTH